MLPKKLRSKNNPATIWVWKLFIILEVHRYIYITHYYVQCEAIILTEVCILDIVICRVAYSGSLIARPRSSVEDASVTHGILQETNS